MNNTATASHLNVEIRLQHCSLTPERKQFLRENLGIIPRLAENFSIARLHMDINKHPSKGDFHLKMSLALNNETLFTGERDQDLMTAFNRCVDKMTAQLKAFKQKLSREHKWEKETERVYE